ncbi:HNH endonuclease signature motif containing protein [Microbacterium arabinogalactanolyticum]|uniref:HNH endonuclease signature motif containing protein n=1 Tax=Microbacterium arabinogalactanolyticum TaxID=69365 RepID=UPI0025526960|nr:HNH endonuclease signature motif containing protein [Microbacterium arabinogalactanolyticum]
MKISSIRPSEHRDVLSGLVEMAQSIEASIDGLLAARDGVLALAARVALSQASDADDADLQVRAVAAELGAALRVSDRTIQRRMVAAEVKVDRFPAVWAAQGAGRISAGHARVIVDAGERIEDADARAGYAQRMVAFAEGESPNRTRVVAERLAEQCQPRSLQERHADAREQRSAWVKDHPDAMAEFGLYGPAVLVHAAFERLTGMGEEVKKRTAPEAGGEGPDADPRTLGQVRADLALDLLLTGAPVGHDAPDGMLAAVTGHVAVTVPVLTLMGAGDEAGSAPTAELTGRSPIDPATARMLAGAVSGWDRVLTDPISGELLAVDRYRPSEHLKRHLRARDGRCRFPGCGTPARDADLDHTLDAAHGGPTEDGNLSALCRRHHLLKHHSLWKVKQIGSGLLEWTSPAGRSYVDRPPPQNAVVFAPSGTDTGESGGGHPPDLWAALPRELRSPF